MTWSAKVGLLGGVTVWGGICPSLGRPPPSPHPLRPPVPSRRPLPGRRPPRSPAGPTPPSPRWSPTSPSTAAGRGPHQNPSRAIAECGISHLEAGSIPEATTTSQLWEYLNSTPCITEHPCLMNSPCCKCTF